MIKQNSMQRLLRTVQYLSIKCLLLLYFTFLCTACVDDQSLEFVPVLDIPPTCSDGIRNQDETAVDCGGACSNVCGNTIRADCSDDLTQNIVSSTKGDDDIIVNRIDFAPSYGGVMVVYADDDDRGITIEYSIPLKDFPVGNMQFSVGQHTNTNLKNPTASVIISSFSTDKISTSGTLYLRVEGGIIHIEFCELAFKSESYRYSNVTYHYEGNINFPRPSPND